jgi:hypothetical protein
MSLGRPGCRCEDNGKVDLNERVCKGVHQMQLEQFSAQAPLNTAMKLDIRRNFLNN